MIAQSQIGFEAFYLWFLANNEKLKNWMQLILHLSIMQMENTKFDKNKA